MMALHPKVIDLVLDRVWRLLAALDHPERRLPPVVHVAGTNGKGSLVAILRAMLEAAGHRVHVYTSPHLVRFAERVRLGAPGGGRLIDDEALVALLEECERANNDQPITFFEITTCAALLAFARAPADVVLLETGLGGRLDATNVVERPALTVITPVSLDHQQYLGDTLASIAGEKAGILKPGVPCVAAAQAPEAAAVLMRRAAQVGAPLSLGGRDWHWDDAGDALRVAGAVWPTPALVGAHQRANAALGVMAARALPPGLRPDDHAMRAGLAGVTWPGRLHRLETGTLTACLPPGWALWLDGGHNPAAGHALADVAASWGDQPLHLIVGMLDTKDQGGFLAPLLARAASLSVVSVPDTPTGVPPRVLADRARTVAPPGVAVQERDDVTQALGVLAETAEGPARVLVCGSLYLVGAVLRDNGTPPV